MRSLKATGRLRQPSRLQDVGASAHRLLSSTTPTPSSSTSSPLVGHVTTTPPSAATPFPAPAPGTTMPLKTLMIANRGEIALRIARTAARMGIRTTSLYTPIDAHAQHVSTPLVDQSLSLGPSNSGYLDADLLVKLTRQHGIQALHPGYGFLSENAAFAERCEKEGIVFVGPPASAMRDMGDKARSKAIMLAAGVPCVPGYHGEEQGVEQLARHARDVGYPVLLKSVKGGGGKGMRIVRSPEEFEAQLTSARAEARGSFGEGGEVMLLEKYIVRPRHVEVQVFADRHGNVLALGERDCSVQRRHQKILEESPAPGLDEALRRDLWDKACAAARAVGYVGAGTVEFILDRDSGQFYFMEMNTRLQVEHPVTEMVVGQDLVEWQFRVAAGERLPLTQEQIVDLVARGGHAIEARIYAEDPDRAFMPDSGRLTHIRTPLGASTATTDQDVRIDAGFVEGDVISEAYDGMIAKLIVRGRDREEAVRRLERALAEYEIAGPRTNVDFVRRLCRHPSFVEGDVETGFIDEHRGELFTPRQVRNEVFVQAALGLLLQAQGLSGEHARTAAPHGQPLGFDDETPVASARKFAFKVLGGSEEQEHGAKPVEVAVTQLGTGLFSARVTRAEETLEPAIFEKLAVAPVAGSLRSSPTKTVLATYFPTARVETTLVRDPDNNDRLTVFQRDSETDSNRTELALLPPTWFETALGLKEAAASVVAPMPCKILRVEVAEGDEVERGAPLVVIESMKMETVIRSPQKGVVKRLAHKEGDICKAGTVLVVFDDEATES